MRALEINVCLISMNIFSPLCKRLAKLGTVVAPGAMFHIDF